MKIKTNIRGGAITCRSYGGPIYALV